jgi:hypothetical protein
MKMGVNLAALRSPRPPGGPSHRSALRSRVIFVNTCKGKGQSAKVYKSYEIRSNSYQNLL